MAIPILTTAVLFLIPRLSLPYYRDLRILAYVTAQTWGKVPLTFSANPP